MMKILRHLTPALFFSKKEKLVLVEAITQAERKTSAEIRLHLIRSIKLEPVEEARICFEKLGMAHLRINAQADGALLEEIAQPDSAGLKLMRDAADAMGLSARGYHRVLRVARTLADLDGREQVARLHIAEALSYRQKLAAFQAAA